MQLYTKAFAAFAAVLIPFLNDVGLALPEFLTVDWLNQLLLILTPIVVFWFPNIKKDGSNLSTASSPAWVGVLALILCSLAVSGCSSTKAAYEAAEGAEETAYVMGEHYFALVREANSLASQGVLTGSALSNAQTVVQQTAPIISKLTSVAQSYEAVSTAENEEQLQIAIAEAAIALSELIDAIKVRGTSSAVIDDAHRDIESAVLRLRFSTA